jgi:hypothetical protein
MNQERQNIYPLIYLFSFFFFFLIAAFEANKYVDALLIF